MKFIRGMASAIVVGGGLLVSGQSFALCSVPTDNPTTTEPTQPTGGDTVIPTTPTLPIEPIPHRDPVNVPNYTPSSGTYGPGSNAVSNGAGTASYRNNVVIVAPTDRAAAERSEWCRRGGRSQGSMDACMRAVLNK